MIAVNPGSMCKQAQAYYYRYLCGEGRECIPPQILAHMDKCRFCDTEVNRLKTVLAEAEERAAGSATQTTSVVTTNLRLHFAYIGVSVTCSTVKPFLPGLAIPALEIRVPTPITVHLDKCQQCANDLEVIRQLDLTQKQLCRLSQILTDEPAAATVSCSQAQAAILSVAAMTFDKLDAEVLKHLCICSDCREQLYQSRESLRTELPPDEAAKRKFPCEAVSATDIFDYCLPYGIGPANDQYAKFRPAFTSHASTCPTCLAKMQQLHSTVYGIAERPESEVVTCFTFEEQMGEGVERESGDLYADWPINVEVLDKSEPGRETSSAPAGSSQALRQRILALNLRQFIKPAVAAAAILIAALLVFYGPVAKGVDLGQVYEALEGIQNVCLIRYVPERLEAAGQIWISRALNIKIFETKSKRVLWDIKDKCKKSKDLDTGSITVAQLDKDVLRNVQETMKVPWGLLPLDDLSNIPKDAEWQAVASDDVETIIADTGVYDLMWTEKQLDGSLVYNRWRGYIDMKTKLPRRIEWWEKRAEEEEYKLTTVMKVTYPANAEIRAIINDAGFW